MKMRSTGLGETVLVGNLDKITRVEDYLVLHVQTIDPVQWHVRAAINYDDLLLLIKLIFKGPVIKFLFSCFKNRKNLKDTDEF